MAAWLMGIGTPIDKWQKQALSGPYTLVSKIGRGAFSVISAGGKTFFDPPRAHGSLLSYPATGTLTSAF